MLSRDSTSAERLRDSRNVRREGNNRSPPGRIGSYENAPLFLICSEASVCKERLRGETLHESWRNAPLHPAIPALYRATLAPRISRGRLLHSSALAWRPP